MNGPCPIMEPMKVSGTNLNADFKSRLPNDKTQYY